MSVSDLGDGGHLAFFRAHDHPFNEEHFYEYFMDAFNHSCPVEYTNDMRFHIAKRVHTMLQENGCRIIYLPPYSPFLNQIENLLPKWKNIVKTAFPRSETDPFNLIESGSREITPSYCDGYYRNMLKCNRRGY
ncbi:hypothetical protein RF11_09613 [Thelohanellus kitauei]|uniref:Tc1-like transposase DDE domain-containing protein n=1 Tax=Thelohanellus kitauei TaxID=669202 RepID=A0A0C2MVR6_THEKT|nr:hypothetical protein RF11_09613 [Thelohanellus kitauei]